MTRAPSSAHPSGPPPGQPDFFRAFTDTLVIDHASIATLGAPFETETISASDERAAQISELQLDVGEGPAWDAYRAQVAVSIPDLGEVPASRWPLFSTGAAALAVQAVHSFPLAIGTLKIGVVDLYNDAAGALTPAAMADAVELAGATATGVLRYSLQHRHDDPADDGPHSRREVHQATGMVIAQMRVGAADALLLIRAHAYASGRSVRETAADITARRISLEP